MTIANRRLLLRANGIYLIVASIAGLLLLDIPAIFFGSGPAAPIIGSAPQAGIGFVEAHGLAFILGVLLVNAPPVRYSHLTAAAVQTLLGVANIVFWSIFTTTDMVSMGVAVTSVHLALAALQFHAASKVDLQLA
jgi:hypothetical protein